MNGGVLYHDIIMSTICLLFFFLRMGVIGLPNSRAFYLFPSNFVCFIFCGCMDPNPCTGAGFFFFLYFSFKIKLLGYLLKNQIHGMLSKKKKKSFGLLPVYLWHP